MHPSETISVSIGRPAGEVYDFVRNAMNLPRWAPGLCRSVRPSGADWEVETAGGWASLRFAPLNALGVLDHVVRIATGEEIHVPLRVVPNDAGSEVLFTLFRLPGMTDAEYAEDRAAVARDLSNLRAVLER